MRRIDELFTAWPFLGSRRMTALLRAEGHANLFWAVFFFEYFGAAVHLVSLSVVRCYRIG